MVYTAGRFLGVFCADDSMVGSQDVDWLQHLMNFLVVLFQCYVFASNVAKSITMMCQPEALRSEMYEKAKALKFTGVVDSYRVRLQIMIPCPECGVDITAGSMTAHFQSMHRTEPAIDCIRLPVSQTEHQPQVYNVRFPRSTKR